MSRRTVTLLVAGDRGGGRGLAAALLPGAVRHPQPGPDAEHAGPDLQRAADHASPATAPTRPPGTSTWSRCPSWAAPATAFNVFTALRAWLTPHDAVVPEQELFPPGQSQQQVVQQDTEQMASSQQTAEAAALCTLGIHFTTVDTITQTEKGLPAAGVLQPGDVITAVDGTPISCRRDTGDLIRAHPPGTPVALTILREGQDRAGPAEDRQRAGAHRDRRATCQESYRFPFPIKINVGDIGGPSAGLMFALGIVDKLTPDNLTGGRFIAGTGEISANGAVVRDRRHPAENGRAPARRGRDGLPDPGRQLPGHQRGGAGRAAPGQGEHAAPGYRRADSHQGRLRVAGCCPAAANRPASAPASAVRPAQPQRGWRAMAVASGRPCRAAGTFPSGARATRPAWTCDGE